MPSASAPFHVIAKPIGPLCNLRCDHCFYLGKFKLYPPRESFRMSDATLEHFIQQYIGAVPEGAGAVQFAWQGGEPTLIGLDFFRRAIALQQQYARSGVRVENVLQTNGSKLNDEWGSFSCDERFLVGISIDGPPELHDRYRRDGRGVGSIERALRGLEVLQKHEVEYNTLTCIQAHNGNHPQRIYRYLRGLGSRFPQFIPIVERMEGGGLTDRAVHGRQFGRFLNAIFDCWLEGDVGKVFVQHFEMTLGLVLGRPASLCVHSETCGRCVALEHDGAVFACDHFVDAAHRIGTLADAPLSSLVDSQQARRFGADKRDMLPNTCRRCVYLRYCNGGCPAHRRTRADGGELALNHLCGGYRLFYKHTLRTFEAMGRCLQSGHQASNYEAFLLPGTTRAKPPQPKSRNAPCPCGSGRKHKRCCGA